MIGHSNVDGLLSVAKVPARSAIDCKSMPDRAIPGHPPALDRRREITRKLGMTGMGGATGC